MYTYTGYAVFRNPRANRSVYVHLWRCCCRSPKRSDGVTKKQASCSLFLPRERKVQRTFISLVLHGFLVLRRQDFNINETLTPIQKRHLVRLALHGRIRVAPEYARIMCFNDNSCSITTPEQGGWKSSTLRAVAFARYQGQRAWERIAGNVHCLVYIWQCWSLLSKAHALCTLEQKGERNRVFWRS